MQQQPSVSFSSPPTSPSPSPVAVDKLLPAVCTVPFEQRRRNTLARRQQQSHKNAPSSASLTKTPSSTLSASTTATALPSSTALQASDDSTSTISTSDSMHLDKSFADPSILDFTHDSRSNEAGDCVRSTATRRRMPPMKSASFGPRSTAILASSTLGSPSLHSACAVTASSACSPSTVSQTQSPDSDPLSHGFRFRSVSDDIDVVRFPSSALSDSVDTNSAASIAVNPFLLNLSSGRGSSISGHRSAASSPDYQRGQPSVLLRPRRHRRRCRTTTPPPSFRLNTEKNTAPLFGSSDLSSSETQYAPTQSSGPVLSPLPDFSWPQRQQQQNDEHPPALTLSVRRVSDDTDAGQVGSESDDPHDVKPSAMSSTFGGEQQQTVLEPGSCSNLKQETGSADSASDGASSRREKRSCSHLKCESMPWNAHGSDEAMAFELMSTSLLPGDNERFQRKRRKMAKRHRALGANEFDAILTQIIPSPN